MRTLMIGLALLASAASAATLRVYPNFAEVRERVTPQAGVVTVSFPQEITRFLVPGSLDLDGVDLVSGTSRVVPSWLKTQEGKTVSLRVDEDTFEPVTLVRAEDLLVRDAAGRYRTVQYAQLAFTDLPPRNPTAPRVQYDFRVAGGSPVLSYLTRGVTWSPRYTLRAENANANLVGLAEIANASEQDYSVDAGAELFAGEVEVQARQEALADNVASFRAAPTAAPAGAPAPKISGGSELRGLQQYRLDTAFALPARSSLTLPFLRPKITFERFGALDTYFSEQASSGKLTRAYRVKSDVFLPAGPITVRDEGRIVGQAQLDDTAENEAAELRLGADADLSYARAVTQVRQDKDAKGNVTAVVYRVTLTLENRKDRVVRAEVTERLGRPNVLVEGQATKTPEGLEVRVDVPAKGKVTRTYTVTLRNP